jgi:hypothetical protein
VTAPLGKSTVLVLALVAYDVFTACALPAGALPPRRVPPRPPRMPDVIVPVAPQSLTLVVGQTLIVRSDSVRWVATVTDESVVRGMPPPKEGESALQWRYRAQLAGTTQITLVEEVSAACPTPPNCPSPPAPRQIVIQVRVTRAP